jgi:histidinol-phosphate aminotransferase
MFELPKKLDRFTPYEPLIGDYKIRLDANESFIEVSPEKIAKAIERVQLNRYPDPYASEAVGAFARLFEVQPAHVVAGNGSDELIGLIVAGLLEKGDRLAVIPPDFSMYSFYAKLYEIEVAEFSRLDEVKDVDCVMFSNPCNPTSLGIEKARIAEFVQAHPNMLVVLDEAYMDFWDESQSLLNQVCEYDNLIVLRTCSKSVALAGIRMGFAVASEGIIAAMKTVKSPFNVNCLSQAIAAEILGDKGGYNESIALIKESVEWLRGELEKLDLFEKIYDSKTNFLYIKSERSREIYEYLLSKSIAVRQFPEHIRICAGSPQENRELIERLREYS